MYRDVGLSPLQESHSLMGLSPLQESCSFDTYRNAIKSKSFQFELGLVSLLQPREQFHMNFKYFLC